MKNTDIIRYVIGFIESLVLVSAIIRRDYSILLLLLAVILIAGKIIADLLDILE